MPPSLSLVCCFTVACDAASEMGEAAPLIASGVWPIRQESSFTRVLLKIKLVFGNWQVAMLGSIKTAFARREMLSKTRGVVVAVVRSRDL